MNSFIDPFEEETKNVKFDGKDYPNVDPNVAPGSASAARRVDEHTLDMTDKTDGKITGTEQIKLSSDLKTLTITVHKVAEVSRTSWCFNGNRAPGNQHRDRSHFTKIGFWVESHTSRHRNLRRRLPADSIGGSSF